MTGPVDLFERFVTAVVGDGASPLQIEAIIRLPEDGNQAGGQLDGVLVSHLLEQAYRRVYGPLHAAHLANFDTIPDWSLSALSIHVVAAAIVDPFIDAAMGRDARLFHLCNRALIQTQDPLPRDLWWTPVFAARLFEANPAIDRQRRPSPSLVLSQINVACYHFCFRGMRREDLPLDDDDPVRPAFGYRRSLRRIVKGSFAMLLDELQRGQAGGRASGSDGLPPHAAAASKNNEQSAITTSRDMSL